MAMNKQKGNMYGFVTHTFNVIKGLCSHGCTYCYMKRWPQKPIRFDESELKTDLGADNFIFVGSSTDMFAEDVQDDWIAKTLRHCFDSQDDGLHNNKYLFQSKNPARFFEFMYLFDNDIMIYKKNIVLATTIETNRPPDDISNTPCAMERAYALGMLSRMGFETMVTIEPIMDFDTVQLLKLIRIARPTSINIGADSGGNNLPEPSKERIEKFIEVINAQHLTRINEKKNLGRLLK